MRCNNMVDVAICLSLLAVAPSVVHAGQEGAGADEASVHHVGTYEDGVIHWRSTIPVDAVTTEPADPFRIDFRYDIPVSDQGSEWSEFHDAERGRMTRKASSHVRVDRTDQGTTDRIDLSEPQNGEMVLEVTREWRPGRGDGLRPPLVTGAGLQRVSLRGVRYHPGEGAHLERYPGYVGPSELAKDPEAPVDFDPEPGVEEGEQIIFVRPDVLPADGLVGSYETSEAIKTRTMWALGGFGLLLAVLGVVAYRRLERPAREEEAEAILAEHGETLDIE